MASDFFNINNNLEHFGENTTYIFTLWGKAQIARSYSNGIIIGKEITQCTICSATLMQIGALTTTEISYISPVIYNGTLYFQCNNQTLTNKIAEYGVGFEVILQ